MCRVSVPYRYQFVVDVGLGKTWLLMEELRKQGKTASIGISNARIDDIDEILRVGRWVTDPEKLAEVLD